LNNTVDPCTTAWIETASGVRFDLWDPTPAMIVPSDIYQALARQCRFGGHCNRFYSVAEHSCHVHDWFKKMIPLADRRMCLAALLHDAAEAYCVDVPRPIKVMLTGYREIEERIQAAIAERFGLAASDFAEPGVKLADNQLLAVEALKLMPSGGRNWSRSVAPADVTLNYWSHYTAGFEFRDRLELYLRPGTL